MTADSSAVSGRRLPVQLSEEAAARRAAFETVSGEREWRDRTARVVLDRRSAEKGWAGKWACHMGRCGRTLADPFEGTFHDPASLTLVHVSRALERYSVALKPVLDNTIREEWARNTDRAPVCRHCQELMRDHVRFEDDDTWETVRYARNA
ncbi:hypothetical protein ACFYPA_14065 [Streptomyces sp. NPDC005775]|uniref:hypothetical protein n=1 Tax=Streptomyces sp. NPDC005775 TaxID=3364729 RepID=UPI0036ACE28B